MCQKQGYYALMLLVLRETRQWIQIEIQSLNRISFPFLTRMEWFLSFDESVPKPTQKVWGHIETERFSKVCISHRSPS